MYSSNKIPELFVATSDYGACVKMFCANQSLYLNMGYYEML